MNIEPKKKRAKRENNEKKIDKDSVKELSDEELDKVAGGIGIECPIGCDMLIGESRCVCPDNDSDDDSNSGDGGC